MVPEYIWQALALLFVGAAFYLVTLGIELWFRE
jgi:hypothetical protein